MADATEAVTKPAMALVDFVKKYWIFGPIVFLVLIAVGMAIKPWFTSQVTSANSSTKGDKLPAALRNFLRIAGFLVPIGAVLLGSDVVYAACAAHEPCGAVASSPGFLAQIWGYLAAIGGLVGFGVLGMDHLTSSDVLDHVTQPGGRSVDYTPGNATTFEMFLRTSTKNKSTNQAPLIAINSTIAVDTTVEQVTAGTNPIRSADLARLLEYVEITSPFYGQILDKVTGTGPILDLVINYIGQGFGRAGDAPTVTIALPVAPATSNDMAITKYFVFPWAQQWAHDPTDTAPWVGGLDQTKFAIRVAASTALAAVSTSAVTKSASHVRSWTSYSISPFWKQTYLPYWRLDTPQSGSDGLSFQNFGGAGPASTKPFDMVHTIGQLSNLLGLPGNLTFETVTNIIATSFGLDDVQNIDGLALARFNAQFAGRIGSYDYATDGNHSYAAVNSGAALDKLLFLLLRQPGLDMALSLLPKFDANTKLPLREAFSSTRTGSDAFIIGAVRELSQQKMQDLSLASGGKIPMRMGQVRHFAAR